MAIALYWDDREDVLIWNRIDADKLRSKKYPQPDHYKVTPDDIDLLVYLHNEIVIPASADYPPTADPKPAA